MIFAPSSTICAPPSCFGGVQQSASLCNGSGTCVSGGTVPCSPYTCNGTACNTSCASDFNCVNGFYCSFGACVVKKSQGATCSAGNECLSNFCVDGFCCDNACNSPCQACSQSKKGSGANGACGNIANGSDPDNECIGASTCNGVGACQ
jgi:hypothetical protein